MGNRVYIDVVARTARLEKGLAKANRNLKKFRGSARRTAGVLKNVLVGAFAAVSARAVVGYVKGILASVDATAKLADRIGETTQEIVRLQHAANITGAGAAKLAAGLDVLQKRLGEAAMGMGEGKAALDRLGLSVADLLEKSPAEQFKDIADGVARLSSKAERAAVTAKLFSRANQDLVNTLALGREGLAGMGAEADALGITFTRLEASKIEKANDEMTKLSAAFRGMATELTLTFTPALAGIVGLLTEAVGIIQSIPGAIASPLGIGTAGQEALGPGRLRGLGGKAGAATVTPLFSPLPESITGDPSQGLAGLRFTAEAQEKIRKGVDERVKLEQKLTEATRKETERRIALANAEADMRSDSAENIAGALVSLTSIGAAESEKMFNLNKAGSIAEVAVATAAGIARGFRELPPPAAWANAGAVAAMGAAQISAINSTSFGGGGSVAPGVAAVGEAGAAGQAASAQQIDVTFSGGGLATREDILRFIEDLNAAQRDGAVLNATVIA